MKPIRASAHKPSTGKIVLLCGILFLLFIGLFMVMNGGMLGGGKKGTSAGISGLPITEKTIDEKTEIYAIKAAYPSFGDALTSLNNQIERDVTNRVNEFKGQAAENWMVMKGDFVGDSGIPQSPFSFDLRWTPSQVNPRQVSFVMNVSWFPGGANMAQDFVTYNWDVKKNGPMALSDLFSRNPNYVQTVSQYCRTDLKKQFIAQGTEENYIAEDLLNEGTAPTAENFSLFTFTDKNITFYFPKYRVAPGASGPFEVVMKR